MKKSMILKGTSKVELLSGRLRFIYGFICKGFNIVFTTFSNLKEYSVKCFEVMRSLLKLSTSFNINLTDLTVFLVHVYHY